MSCRPVEIQKGADFLSDPALLDRKVPSISRSVTAVAAEIDNPHVDGNQGRPASDRRSNLLLGQ
jgi:hypothetical protein